MTPFKPIMRLTMLLITGLAGVTACDGPNPVSPEAVIAEISAVSPLLLTAPVGTNVIEPPSVRALDARGHPLAGVTISFTVTSGGGTISNSAVVTDASGVATLARWTLGKTPVGNAVEARVGTQSILFRVDAVAGPPHTIVKLGGDFQIATAGQPVPARPLVRIEDQYQNPIPGVAVTIKVLTGGGAISGGTGFTTSSGLLSIAGWKLGTSGTQTLLVSSGTASTVFTATIIEFPLDCASSQPLIAENQQIAQLTGSSCRTSDGRAYSLLTLTATESARWQITVGAYLFATTLQIFTPDGRLIATGESVHEMENAVAQAILPAGTYLIVAGSATPFALGNIAIGATTRIPLSVCSPVFIVLGSTITGAMPRSTCGGVGDGDRDTYRLRLDAGTQVTITVSDKSYSGPQLELTDAGNAHLVSGQHTADYLETIVFIAPATGFYNVLVHKPMDLLPLYDLVVK